MYKIKKLNIIILSIIIFSISGGANAANRLDDLMVNANQAYQNKEYDQALKLYSSILNEGYISEALFYNLGNTYFRLGKLGKSILFYERALKLVPDDENTIYNLSIAKARTKDKIKAVPQLFFLKWWNSFITLFPASGWTIIVFFLYLILLFQIAFWFFTKSSSAKQFAFFGGTATFFTLALAVTLLISSINHESSNKNGILLQQITTAKVSPDNSSSDAFVIHEGVKFQLEDELDGWSEIKLADGKVGWISKNSFEEI